MNPAEHMDYLKVARAVLGRSSATKATKATKVVLEEVWRSGGWLVLSAGGVQAVRVESVLSAWVTQHQEEVLQVLGGVRHSARSRRLEGPSEEGAS